MREEGFARLTAGNQGEGQGRQIDGWQTVQLLTLLDGGSGPWSQATVPWQLLPPPRTSHPPPPQPNSPHPPNPFLDFSSRRRKGKDQYSEVDQ